MLPVVTILIVLLRCVRCCLLVLVQALEQAVVRLIKEAGMHILTVSYVALWDLFVASLGPIRGLVEISL